MGLPRLNSCCCGCSLRTGTLILLYLSLVFGLTLPFNSASIEATDSAGHTVRRELPSSTRIPSAIIIVAISVCGLYGVYTGRHGFLIPVLIIKALGIIGFAVGCVFVLLINFVAALFGLAFLLLSVYLWLVIYNHYRELEEGKGSSSAA